MRAQHGFSQRLYPLNLTHRLNDCNEETLFMKVLSTNFECLKSHGPFEALKKTGVDST